MKTTRQRILWFVAAALLLWPILAFAQRTTPVPDPLFTDAVAPPAAPPRGITIDGVVDRVIDGDTVVVSTVVTYHVRLLDCWAPESRTLDKAEKVRGLKSKARMTELAEGQAVRVNLPVNSGDVTQLITLGRVLGRVWILQDGRPQSVDLSTQMVAEGLATATKESPLGEK